MSPDRFDAITSRYPGLCLVVAGDFCLDRYFEIDPARSETSIETGLEVYNVSAVRCQPGAAGTILNNLSALGIGTILPVGCCGEDGEGWELRRALLSRPGVRLDFFESSPLRHTFTYSKPLVIRDGEPPRELNRLDLKNWTATPESLQTSLLGALRRAIKGASGVILMDQVDLPETGVVTSRFRAGVGELKSMQPELLVVGDSRQGLRGWPPVIFKMNARELGALTGGEVSAIPGIQAACAALARANRSPAFVTLAELGIVGADADGRVGHVPAFPVSGPIDIVGAGDSVTANLTAALAAGAGVVEAMELAMAAASVVVHQLGTTGTATVAQIRERIL
ncbi:MAG: carbohydrate kinase [Verrucomicrobiales bacterium]|nr:carbohydrate kinase [Verrucomicrobiales bacterium]